MKVISSIPCTFHILITFVYLEGFLVQPEGDNHSVTTNVTSLPHAITVLEYNSGRL